MMQYSVYAVVSVNSGSWHGEIEKDDITSCSQVVLAMGPGDPPAVRVWTAKTGRLGSRPVQKPDPLTLGGPNPDP